MRRQLRADAGLSGNTCTATTTAADVPFGASVTFYCESATSLNGHYIDAVQDTMSPLYAKSVFNPAYQIYTYYAAWSGIFQSGNANASGCTTAQTWYLAMAVLNTGGASSSCTFSGNGANYVKEVGPLQEDVAVSVPPIAARRATRRAVTVGLL